MSKSERLMGIIPTLGAIEFIGLAHLLKVSLLNDNKEPRDFTDVLEDVMKAYEKTNRKRRREIMQLLKSRTEVAPDASNSEDS